MACAQLPEHTFDLDSSKVTIKVDRQPITGAVTWFCHATPQNARIIVVIPHQFEDGEDPANRDYNLSIIYQPHANFVRDNPAQGLEIEAPYQASAHQDEPLLRQGNFVKLPQATRKFKEIIDPGGDATPGDPESSPYLSDPEYGATQTITVEVMTPGIALLLHGPSTFGDSGPVIDRPTDAQTPYSGLLPGNIDNDRQAEPTSPTESLADWGRENLNPAAAESQGDDDFVLIKLELDPGILTRLPGLQGQVAVSIPGGTRVFSAAGSEITEEQLVVDLSNPTGPLSELVNGGSQMIWIEAGEQFTYSVGSLVALAYEIFGNVAGQTGAITALGKVHPVNLDVSGDKQVDKPEDGLTTFLPGYRGDEAMLHDSSKSFAELEYTGLQKLHLVLEGAAHLQAEFEIIMVSSHPGFAVNTPHDGFAEGAEEDFSFDPEVNQRNAIGEPAGEHLVVPLYCKDYGGHCIIQIIVRDANGEEIARTRRLIPNKTRQLGIADAWLIAEGERWEEIHGELPVPGGDFAPGDDTEPKEPHETEGDGLTVFEEYRGFILGGGRDENGPHEGGHRRLSPARKELLVHASMIPGLPEEGLPKNFMPGVAELYNHPEHGVDIDIHWIVTEQGYPTAGEGGADLNLGPVEYVRPGIGDRDHAYQHHQNGATYFIFHDSALATSDEEEDRELSELLYATPPFPNGSSKPYIKASQMRRPEYVSPWFRHLMLFGKAGRIGNDGSIVAGTSNAFYGRFWPPEEMSAVILVKGMGAEPGILEANLHYAVSHELFHMIIEKHDIHPWNSAEHLPNSPTVMEEPPPARIPSNIRLEIPFGTVERSAVNLADRRGLHPKP